jgi:putative membrane protein
MRQQLWIVPVAKIQSLGLSRSWLQRRLGIATVAIDTAGAPLMNAPRIVDLSEEGAKALIARLSVRIQAGSLAPKDSVRPCRN